ncbi:MAG: hypothetical protein R3C49_21640 [Planctomycetaceae bacterium]
MTKYAAHLAAQDAAKTATAQKDAALSEAVGRADSIARLVKKGNDGANRDAGTSGPVASQHRPNSGSCADQVSSADVMNTACLELTLMILNPDSKTRRAKPAECSGV